MRLILLLLAALTLAATQGQAEEITATFFKDGKPFRLPAAQQRIQTARIDRIVRDCWLYLGERPQEEWGKAAQEPSYILIRYEKPVQTPTLSGLADQPPPGRETIEEAIFTIPQSGALMVGPLVSNGKNLYSLAKCPGQFMIAFQCRPELADFFPEGYKKSCHFVKEWGLE